MLSDLDEQKHNKTNNAQWIQEDFRIMLPDLHEQKHKKTNDGQGI